MVLQSVKVYHLNFKALLKTFEVTDIIAFYFGNYMYISNAFSGKMIMSFTIIKHMFKQTI